MESSEVFKAIYPEEVYAIPVPSTVVIDTPWQKMDSSQKELLSKILGAVRLSLESVRLRHDSHIDLSSWKEKPAKLIAFLPPPKGLNLYEVIQAGETSMIFSDSLSALSGDDGAKRKLWSALKSMFPA